MGVAWTKEQLEVIETRDRNILVSAAAGSGKTAVLVERIISMVTDEKNPVDIDRLLIVTFTNAAAGEMRERIREALNKKLEELGRNVHLERQVTLVHNAQITTIDSFCKYVIQNHFHTIGLDPGFRIGEEGELKMLKGDVLDSLLEDAYEEKSPRYLKFVEAYASGKNDKGLEELILQLYGFSMSYPWPVKWLRECILAYEAKEWEDMEKAPWMGVLLRNLTLQLEDAATRVREAIDLALSEDGPYMYEDALRSDLELVEALKNNTGYEAYAGAFRGAGKYARLSAKKDTAVSEQKKEQVKSIRDQVKKTIKGLQEQYFYADIQVLLEDMQGCRECTAELLHLAEEFSIRFGEKKREKNVIDFHDMEHFALNILVEEKEGEVIRTAVAKELSGHFYEILIDEYQDSNLVQELILTSVSKAEEGRNNVFMVGDVKQSIYRFRLARPELFMEKYDTYPRDGEEYRRIDLHKNFRSRGQVLDSVNYIFYQIMARYLGNVEYDEDAALYTGAVFPEGNQEEFAETQLLLADLDSAEEVEEDIEESSKELEARMIGSRILEMQGKDLVFDKETKEYRPAELRDIVILLRTVSGWAESFGDILGHMGIPTYTGSQTGYFSTLEIQNLLSLLKILDNPRQDIPLAAVLRSPIGKFEEEDLARMRSGNKEKSFYDCCISYSQTEEKDAGKLRCFFEQMNAFRNLIPYTPIHQLLWTLLEETGYGDYMAAMPGGAQRKANLQMLIEKAISYESTSYRGLFNFVRYIEQLKKYEIDYGEANITGERENAVRIMSIHKSKGLEFPVVFVAGMGKVFNQQDSRSRLLLHPELGLGCDSIDAELRVKSPTLLKKVIQRETINENLGEELRVLYVALTRAKEKLILTGSLSKLEDKMKKWGQVCDRKEIPLSFTQLSGATTYLDWIVPSLMRHKSFQNLLTTYEISQKENHKLYDAPVSYGIRVYPVSDLVQEEIEQQADKALWKEMLLHNHPSNEALDKELEEIMNYSYPYLRDGEIHGKLTVSEIKRYYRESQEEQEEASEMLFEEPQIVPLIPAFMQEKEAVPGAVRGTAYHKVLEELTFQGDGTIEEVADNVHVLLEKGKLKQEEADLVDIRKLSLFLQSPLGRRMSRADKEGKLIREQQFILGVDADTLKKEWNPEEMVLVQGIIDAYFYEEDEIVVVDYKTDFVGDGTGQALLEKYGIQLDYYGKALGRLTGKKVREKCLYSFWLQKELRKD